MSNSYDTTELEEATYLYLQGYAPTVIRRPKSGDHWTFVYDRKPPEEVFRGYVQDSLGIRRALNVYHRMRKQAQRAKRQAGQLGFDEVPFED
jgi:hypothetical protein